MALCKDPQLTYLNKLGYNVVRLPREGIVPLDVLGKDGKSIERLGNLTQIWNSSQSKPQVKPPNSAANINGQKTDALDLSIGLKILAQILGGMGATVPQLNLAYNRARKVRFTFTNVQVISVDPFALGNFLSSGDLASHNPFVTRYFVDDDTEAFVMTETLTSDSITVVGENSDGLGVEVDVPAIQAAVGAKVAVKTSGSSSRELTYRGQEFLTFGFKVFRIDYENGRWVTKGVKADAGIAFGPPGTAAAAPEGDPILFREGSMVSIR